MKSLGIFDTAEEAALAYDQEVKKLGLTKRVLNFAGDIPQQSMRDSADEATGISVPSSKFLTHPPPSF